VKKAGKLKGSTGQAAGGGRKAPVRQAEPSRHDMSAELRARVVEQLTGIHEQMESWQSRIAESACPGEGRLFPLPSRDLIESTVGNLRQMGFAGDADWLSKEYRDMMANRVFPACKPWDELQEETREDRVLAMRGRASLIAEQVLGLRDSVLSRGEDDQKREGPVLTDLQQQIYDQLDREAYTAEALALLLARDGKDAKDDSAIKRALRKLKDAGLIANKRGRGYYRPDAPPRIRTPTK
jgi:hypothetical protein